MLGEHHVDVGEVVEHLAVELLRHALVEAAVARFHVEDRNLAALGRDHRQAAVGVAQHQHGLGLHLGEYAVDCNDQVTDGVRRASAAFGAVQEVIRLAHTQVVEEDLIQLVVVVLAGVHQDMVAVFVERGQHPRQANDLGPCTNHGYDFEFFHLHL